MPLAKRSGKSTVEDQQDVLPALKFGKSDFLSIEIRKDEVWSGLVEFDTITHAVSQCFFIAPVISGFALLASQRWVCPAH